MTLFHVHLLLLLPLLLPLLQVVSLVACHDGSHAASIGTDGCLRLWSLATGACISSQVGGHRQHLLSAVHKKFERLFVSKRV